MTEPNSSADLAVLEGTPHRHHHAGSNLDRVKAVADLRARTHELMPDFVLECLEDGRVTGIH